MKIFSGMVLSLAMALSAAGAEPAKALANPFSSGEAGVMTRPEQVTTSPADALAKLRAGNARFLTGQRVARDFRAQVKASAEGQFPFATVVACMDSRVAVEHIFDLGLGDVFTVRIAGNVVDEETLGSLEYAHKVAGAKLIVVMGHSHCGAVKSAVDDVVLGNLQQLLARIKPAVQAVPDDGKPRTSHNHAFVDRVARMNVIFGVRTIRERSAVLRDLHDKGVIDIVGAFYDVETGKVEFYRPISAGQGDKAAPVLEPEGGAAGASNAGAKESAPASAAQPASGGAQGGH